MPNTWNMGIKWKRRTRKGDMFIHCAGHSRERVARRLDSLEAQSSECLVSVFVTAWMCCLESVLDVCSLSASIGKKLLQHRSSLAGPLGSSTVAPKPAIAWGMATKRVRVPRGLRGPAQPNGKTRVR